MRVFAELEKIIDKIKKKGKNKDFDCIVGLSGGMDSSYMLHVLVKEFWIKTSCLFMLWRLEF